MATITSAASGNWSAGATWVGGVAPISTDNAIVANTHAVKLDGTRTIVNCTINAGGKLYHDTAANSELICTGTLTVSGSANLSPAPAEYVMGENGAAIPSGVTAICTLTNTPSLLGWVRMRGAAKTRKTTLTSAISVGGSSVTVADSTGWAIGDVLVVPGINGTASTDEVAVITGGSAPTWNVNVGVSGGTFATAHASGTHVANMSCNVIMRSTANNTTIGTVSLSTTNAAPGFTRTDKYEFYHCLFENVANGGPTINATSWVADLSSSSTHPFKEITGVVSTNRWLPSRSSSGAVSLSTQAFFVGGFTVAGSADLTNRPMTSCVAVLASGGFGIQTSGRAVVSMSGCLFIGGTPYRPTSGAGGAFASCDSYNAPSGVSHISFAGGFGLIFTSSVFHGGAAFASVPTTSPGGTATFQSCQIGTAGEPITNFSDSTLTNAPLNLVCRDTTTNYSYDSSFTAARANWTSQISFGGATSTQLVKTNRGDKTRDATTYKTAAPSYKYTPNTSVDTVRTLFDEWQVPAKNGIPGVVYGYIRKDSAYGSSNRPIVSISGAGITPQSWTMPDTVDTWELFSFAFTQSSGADTTLTLRLDIGNTTGNVYADDFSVTLASAVSTGAMDFFVDGAPVKFLLSNFVAPGDVVTAMVNSTTPFPCNVKQVNSYTVQGDGTVGNEWGP